MTENNSTFFELKDSGDFVRIEIIGLKYPNAELDWDRNWVDSRVSVKAGSFSGKFCANLMTTDFEIFKRELKKLYENLNGAATFEGMESQVIINIKGDGIGHLNAKCWLMDYAGTGNELKLEIDFDQTQIPEMINQLEKITTEFPTIGELKIKSE